MREGYVEALVEADTRLGADYSHRLDYAEIRAEARVGISRYRPTHDPNRKLPCAGYRVPPIRP